MWVQAVGIARSSSSSTASPASPLGAVLLGVGTAMVYPTLLAAIGDVAHPSWRASSVGVYRLWRDLGYAVGAVIAGVLADALGLDWAIGAVAVADLCIGRRGCDSHARDAQYREWRMTPVYLDFNASTPIAADVTAAMRAVSDEGYGNPSSTHWAASAAKQSLEASRAQVADLLGSRAQEIVFTSGGSEANNLAIKGVYFARRNPTAHIITSAIEHPSVLAPCGFLEGLGARVTRLPVDRTGRIDPEDLRRMINADTILISLMHANNEVGTIEPIEECCAHRSRAWHHLSH